MDVVVGTHTYTRTHARTHAQTHERTNALTNAQGLEGIPSEAVGPPEGPPGRRVLNVGFGMGIIDSALARRGPGHHTIIEAHPAVYAKMVEAGWTTRPNVTVAFGRWQDVIQSLGTFDGIFFDTYGEYYADMKEFHDLLPRVLNPRGIYSFFNGMCPFNIFFHGVACELVKVEFNPPDFTPTNALGACACT